MHECNQHEQVLRSEKQRWMLQCETPVRKVMVLISLSLMTKLYEDNICDAAVDRMDEKPGHGG